MDGESFVTGTGNAIATQGSIANTGILTIIQPPVPVEWPIAVGRIPPLAASFQDRSLAWRSATHPINAVKESNKIRVCRLQKKAKLPETCNVVICGGAGVGKSQLAAQKASKAIRDGIDLVVWVDASDSNEIPILFARAGSIVRASGVVGGDNPVADDAIVFRDWLQATSHSWLVVFDDIVNPSEVAQWWPTSHKGCGSVIATTRRRDTLLFASGRQRVDVDVFSHSEARSYITNRLMSSGVEHLLDDGIDELIEALGCLPLALSHASSYIVTQRVPVSRYMQLFQTGNFGLDWLLPEDPDQGDKCPISATLLISLKILMSDPSERTIIQKSVAVASVLSPSGFPALIWDKSSALSISASSSKCNPNVRKSLILLSQHSLVTLEGDHTNMLVRMHSLTAKAVRERLTDIELIDALKIAANALLEIWSDDEFPHPDFSATLRQNAMCVLEPLNNDCIWSLGEVTIRLIRRVHKSLISAGAYFDALKCSQEYSRRAQKYFGSESLSHLLVYSNLVEAYLWCGELENAISVGELLMPKLAEMLGEDDPVSLSLINAVAIAYRQNGCADKAIHLGEYVTKYRCERLGSTHRDTLESSNNLAVAYWHNGSLLKAISLHESTLQARLRNYGEKDPDTLESQSNLAVAYWQIGELNNAIKHGKKAAVGRALVLGRYHPRTLESEHNLTTYLCDTGNFDEAMVLGEHVYSQYVATLGDGHIRTLGAKHNLARCYRLCGLVEKALSVSEQVELSCSRILGDRHRLTLAARENLAATYACAGMLNNAVSMAQSTVVEHEQVLGIDHPNTIRAQNTLVSALLLQNYVSKAVIKLAYDVTVRSRLALGERHPHAKTAAANYAEISRRAGF